MTRVNPWVRKSLLAAASVALTASLYCGGSSPTSPAGPSSRSWDDYDPAPDQYVEPQYREPVGIPKLLDETDPWTDPPDGEQPPPDEGPIDEPVPDPYVEDPDYWPSDEGPIDEPVPDPYVEDPPIDPDPPGDEPVPDPNPDDPPPDPDMPGDDPEPDPDMPPGDEPAPDPYVEDPPPDPDMPPGDEPAPDPYVEDPPPDPDMPPGDEPAPDPYVEDPPPDPDMEYYSVIPVHDGRGPARLADLDDDGSFRRWGPVLHLGGLRFEYQARYQPGHLRGSAYHAVGRALGTWEREAQQRLFHLVFVGQGERGPERDGRSVVCWRNFTGPGATFPAVVYVWDNGRDVVEADIVLNTGRAFGIGAALQSGEARVLEHMLFDLQAVVTHEVGHVLGLADRDNAASEGSTMHEGLRMRELRAQTLASGDRNGLAFLLRQARPTRPEQGKPDRELASVLGAGPER